ncbi:DUF166 domain-containing protein, partial [Methanocaldococcus infernus]
MKALFIYHEGNKIMEKFYNNLINAPDFCKICEDCYNCRGDWSYKDYVDKMVIKKADEEFIDEPEEYFEDVPKAEYYIAQLHEDLLYHLAHLIEGKALIVPSESPHDLSLGMRRELEKICKERGIIFKNPKPFCSLEGLDEFTNFFKIGKPKVEVIVENDIIKDVKVLVSSPCGETYYIAKRLKGKKLDEMDKEIADAHHNYPCLASMELDKELGDTILHKAGYIAREAF